MHAGEAYGPESIFQAITDLHADRIGHGTYLLEADQIRDPEIEDREHYVDRLGNYIADRRITLEVCLTSNLQTNPHLKRLDDHTFRKLRAQRLSTTLCTDNRLMSNTTVTNELSLAVKHLGLDRHDLKSIIIYGFKRSFFPGSYLSKRQYVRQIIDHYDAVERRHFGVSEFWQAVLERWTGAGVVDAAAAERIRAWEAEHGGECGQGPPGADRIRLRRPAPDCGRAAIRRRALGRACRPPGVSRSCSR